MEKLSKNHPRFCAKYVQKIGIAKQEKVGWQRVFKLHGKYFICSYGDTYQPGDKVLVVKRVPNPGNEWIVHEIILCEDYWHYEYFMNRSAKEQRTTPYKPVASGWFGRGRYIVTEASMEYIKRHFAFK